MIISSCIFPELSSPQDGLVGAEVLAELGDVLGVVPPGVGVPLVDGGPRLVRRHQSLQERDLRDSDKLYTAGRYKEQDLTKRNLFDFLYNEFT